MTCDQFAALLSRWLEDDLSPAEAQEMLAHQADCRDCAELSETLRLLLLEADEMPVELPVPEPIQDAWREALAREQAAPRSRTLRFPRLSSGVKRFTAVAAAALLLVSATLLTRDRLATPKDAPVLAFAGEGGTLQRTALEMEAPMAAPPAGDSDVLFATDRVNAQAGRPAGTLLERGAQFSLSTQHFDIDAEKLLLLPQELGGWVAQQSLSGRSFAEEGEGRFLSLSLRIPVDRLEDAQGYMDSIGRLEARETYARDISSEYYDVQGRLESAWALHTQLQSLMEKTEDVETLATLTREISDNQLLIDGLQGSLEGMDSRVAYSEVTVRLTERAPRTIVGGGESRSLGTRIREGFLDSLRSIRSFLTDLMVAVVWLLPWLLPLALIVLVVVIWWRRRRRNR